MCNSLLKSLIKKFREQDMSSFTIIYDEFKRLIYHYSGRLGDDDSVQELTVFLVELLYSIDIDLFKSDTTDGLRRYIAVCLKNRYIALSREFQKLRAMSFELFDYSAGTEISDDMLIISEALNILTTRQKAIIIYKYIYCYSDTEIAKMLNTSRQAVNRLKNRAFVTLRQFYGLPQNEDNA